MTPETYGIVVVALWLLTSVGVRVLLHRCNTGFTGVNRMRARPGSLEWVGGFLFVLSLIVLCGGVFATHGRGDWTVRAHIGAALSAFGVGLTFVARGALGDSWRIGVNPMEKTTLRTQGLYSIVRNPIFSAMILTTIGLVTLTPTAMSVAGLVGLVLSIELQVRFVEEPYLHRTHGDRFATYKSRTGRFIPKHPLRIHFQPPGVETVTSTHKD
jgi:protein-S-isoprenylcysteine O-methyltransferase Ste14